MVYRQRVLCLLLFLLLGNGICYEGNQNDYQQANFGSWRDNQPPRKDFDSRIEDPNEDFVVYQATDHYDPQDKFSGYGNQFQLAHTIPDGYAPQSGNEKNYDLFSSESQVIGQAGYENPFNIGATSNRQSPQTVRGQSRPSFTTLGTPAPQENGFYFNRSQQGFSQSAFSVGGGQTFPSANSFDVWNEPANQFTQPNEKFEPAYTIPSENSGNDEQSFSSNSFHRIRDNDDRSNEKFAAPYLNNQGKRPNEVINYASNTNFEPTYEFPTTRYPTFRPNRYPSGDSNNQGFYGQSYSQSVPVNSFNDYQPQQSSNYGHYGNGPEGSYHHQSEYSSSHGYPENYKDEDKEEGLLSLIPKQTKTLLEALGTYEKALEFKLSFFAVPISDLFTTTLASTTGQPATSFSTALIFNRTTFLLIGILVVAAIVLFPAIGSTIGLGNARTEKSLDNRENMLDTFYKQLKDLDIDGEECTKMIFCSATKKTSESILQKTAGPTEKLISGFMSYGQVQQLVNSTRFFNAFEDGFHRENCEEKYENCPFSVNMIEAMIEKWIISYLPFKLSTFN